MSVFDRFLSLWVALCIVAGVLLGNLFPGFFQIVAGWEYASVNLVVAVLIWAIVCTENLIRSLDPFSGSESSSQKRSSADFITTTSGFRLSVHTTMI